MMSLLIPTKARLRLNIKKNIFIYIILIKLKKKSKQINDQKSFLLDLYFGDAALFGIYMFPFFKSFIISGAY